MSILNIVIIEDHLLVREGLRMLFKPHPEFILVGEAGRISDAVELVEREKPDIILLDIGLEDGNGLDLLPRLLDLSPTSKILILTALHEPDLHLRAVSLGAMGVFLKDDSSDLLFKAIRKIHQGEVWIDRTMMARVLNEISNAADKSDLEAAKLTLLTEREREVISLIGEGLKNKQIAERLYISEGTVRHHLTSVFVKLEVADRLELVIYAYRFGLVNIQR